MTAPDGRPTNAVFGVDARPAQHLPTRSGRLPARRTFDTPEPTFRNEICPDYKAHREPPPADLTVQVPMIHAVLEAMNMPVLRRARLRGRRHHGDRRHGGRGRGIDVILCTTDKDCRQLIGDRVKMLNLRKKTYIRPRRR